MLHYENMHVATAQRQRMLQEEPVPALVVPAEVVVTSEPYSDPAPVPAPVEPAQTILGVPVYPVSPVDENAPPAI